jgi:hypothetical protein
MKREEGDFMEHSQEDFQQVISIQWDQLKDGHHLHSCLLERVVPISRLELPETLWMLKI